MLNIRVSLSSHDVGQKDGWGDRTRTLQPDKAFPVHSGQILVRFGYGAEDVIGTRVGELPDTFPS